MRRDRQADLWARVESDPEFRAIVTGTWRAILENLPPPPPEDVARAQFQALLEQVAGDVAKIRARGGEVVFIRPPSSGFFRAFERKAVPRERVWQVHLAGHSDRGSQWLGRPVRWASTSKIIRRCRTCEPPSGRTSPLRTRRGGREP